MNGRRNYHDTVRPSRDGHEFHEAWTARKAMGLLLPRDGLIGIAVEGLSERDQRAASPETIEIADLTVYYGEQPNFEDAHSVETLQFKYSPSNADKPFRASDAKQTIAKFAESYRDYKNRFGDLAVSRKLCFGLITNRPILRELTEAVEGIAQGRRLTGVAKAQSEQFIRAAKLKGSSLEEFASKCSIIGQAGSLSNIKSGLSRVLIDWSATNDAMARARLGKMRELVRTKAGYDARDQKVIRKVDVLSALEISEVEELLPCPPNLPEVGDVLDRDQVVGAADKISSLDTPLLVHAVGGVGKTVFLNSLASRLSQQHEVVFFDCFGGGAYRSPDDARHLPRRGLVHLINELACRGLCDPVLPGGGGTEDLVRTFRRRLEQCVKTISATSRNRLLVLVIDAIDNAACHAEDLGEESFPKLVMKSFHHAHPVEGVRLIVSSRTHRIERALGDIPHTKLELPAFSSTETAEYLRARIPNISETETQVAQARSGGNARVLEHFATSDRGLLDAAELDRPIELDDLLRQRTENALTVAKNHGYSHEDISAFLAGLAVLPPPVPMEEYASAHDLEIGAVQSFAADLAPLLEQTQLGLTFRDEPTETFVRESFGSDKSALSRVADRLLARQNTSVYATRTLPSLLLKLNQGSKLFELAFDDSFPDSMTSLVGRRRIRHARISAAVLHAAANCDNNQLVRLLVEMSTIAASEQHGAEFIFDHPDLVVCAGDVDAMRRLLEARTGWPGSRHARLTIANVLSGDLDTAARNYANTVTWLRHDLENTQEDDLLRPGPEPIDHAAPPFYWIAQGTPERAAKLLGDWPPWYGYQVSEKLFSLMEQAKGENPQFGPLLNAFLDALTLEIECLAAALACLELSEQRRRDLVEKLVHALQQKGEVQTDLGFGQRRRHGLENGLRKAVAIANALGLKDEAREMFEFIREERIHLSGLEGPSAAGDTLSFLFQAAIEAATQESDLGVKDILPKELRELSTRIDATAGLDSFRNQLKEQLHKKRLESKQARTERVAFGEAWENAGRFLDEWFFPLFQLGKAIASLLGTAAGSASEPFEKLVGLCDTVSRPAKENVHQYGFPQFIQELCVDTLLLVFWMRNDIKPASAASLLQYLQDQEHAYDYKLIELVATMSVRSVLVPNFGSIAGEEAVRIKGRIDHDNDVGSRASTYGHLARAILPASVPEAREYFRLGLEQFDALGSTDTEYTNGLLRFASSMKGRELCNRDVHTFSNICELNMSYEPSGFPWADFGMAMSKISGLRGLAKLSRWHDRGTVSFSDTLLPYLTALLRDEKISTADAVSLNRLAIPRELLACNTEALAQSLHERNGANAKDTVAEIIFQYEQNSIDKPIPSILDTLATIASDVLGEQHTTTKYLSRAQERFQNLNDLEKKRRNHISPEADRSRASERSLQEDLQVKELAEKTNPLDAESLANAIIEMKESHLSRDRQRQFFSLQRQKVRLSERLQYIEMIAGQEHLDIYGKLDELTLCKGAWSSSSASLQSALFALAERIVGSHIDDFLVLDRFSGEHLKEISQITGASLLSLATYLLKALFGLNHSIPSLTWLGLASIFCSRADEGESQAALERLLNSESAALASRVADGSWSESLSPANDIERMACDLIWQMLGSPIAADRWLAAHSVRCFARLGRWQVVDALMTKLESTESTCCQAPELRFYRLHARLWLLIAVARMALDHPQSIAKYSDILKEIAFDSAMPHAVIRHFAAAGLLECESAGESVLSNGERSRLEAINKSPFPYSGDAPRNGYLGIHEERPPEIPEPEQKFWLDYDFERYWVEPLARLFSQPGWKLKDRSSEEVHRIDPTASSMYDDGGREITQRHGSHYLSSNTHLYGQYLAWHALRIVGGRLVKEMPIVEESLYGDPLEYWLERMLLTRNDGYWLSDGMDRPPLHTKHNLLEQEAKGLVLTGDREKLLNLVGIQSEGIAEELIVAGDWVSPDGVSAHIFSGLAPREKAADLADQLIKENPFTVWLPNGESDEEFEGPISSKPGYDSWIHAPYPEVNELDANDLLGVISVQHRPRFTPSIVREYSLKACDRFQREWRSKGRGIVASTIAWGRKESYEEHSVTGAYLNCRSRFLAELLRDKKAILLLLIKLRRFKKSSRRNSGGSYSPTVAVLCVKEDLSFQYLPGAVNHVDVPKL